MSSWEEHVVEDQNEMVTGGNDGIHFLSFISVELVMKRTSCGCNCGADVKERGEMRIAVRFYYQMLRDDQM
jgi:hypothetical protein